MTFKNMVKQDIQAVFLNLDEFAEVTPVVYDGRDYNIPVVIDNDEDRDRRQNQTSNDITPGRNAPGLFVAGIRAFISFKDLGIVPNKNTQITIDGVEYNITKSADEMGMIVLELEELNE